MFQLGSHRKAMARLDARLTGDVHAWVLPLAVPVAVAEGLLPPGLELAAQRWTPPGQHPLLLVAQRLSHVNVDSKTLPRVPFVDFSYREFAVTLPYVRQVVARPGLLLERLLAYTPLTLVDHALPAVGGLIAGFAQQVRRCRIDDFGAEVRSLSSDALQLSMQIEPAGEWRLTSELQGARLLGEAVTLPQLGPSPTAGLQVSDWRLERSTAQIQPIRATVDLGDLGLAGLPRGRYLLAPLLPGEVGALAVRGKWHMGMPRDLADVDLGPVRVSWSHAHKLTDVVRELQTRLDRAQSHGLAMGYFEVWFLRMALRARAAAEAGAFADAPAISRVLGGLCDRYIDAARTAELGFRPSQPWQVALGAGADKTLLSLQHLALGLNAQWGLDLAIVVADSVRADYLPRFLPDLEKLFDLGEEELAAVAALLVQREPALRGAEPWGPSALGPGRLSLAQLRARAWEAACELAALSPEHRLGPLAALEWQVARRADQLDCYSALPPAEQRAALHREHSQLHDSLSELRHGLASARPAVPTT